MYISRVKLVNFIGIYIGQKCETLEIKMDNKYPITLIRAPNGVGKSVLLSALSSPFPYDGGIDNRSNVNIIRTGYLGEKELTYEDGNDTYFIHHYYKPNQNNSHSVKSYICKNGVELNSNGNLSSFEQIIQSTFGITQKDLMLFRLGTNTVSFSSLSSMERKKYLSRIIGDIDTYMALFRDIQYDIRLHREMINKFSVEMNKLNIDDIGLYKQERDHWKEQVQQLYMEIGKSQQELNSIASENIVNVEELLQERTTLSGKISFVEHMDPELKKSDIDTLRKKRSEWEIEQNQLNNKITSTKASIDSDRRGIEFAEIDLKKMEVDDSLSEKISALKEELSQLKERYKQFHPSCTSGEFTVQYQKIGIIRTWMTVIVGYDQEIIQTVLKLFQENTDITQWVDQSMSNVLDLDTKQIMGKHLKQLCQNGYHTPECQDVNCVYRKMGEMILQGDETSVVTSDFIRSVQDVYKTYCNMIMEARQINGLPKQLTSIISQKNLDDLLAQGSIFSLDLFDQYLHTLLGYESYQLKCKQLDTYKEQESAKKRMIVLRGESLKRIQMLTESIQLKESKLTAYRLEQQSVSEKLSQLDIQIGKRLEYDNVKSMLTSYRQRVREIDEKVEKFHSNQPRMNSLRQKIDDYQNSVQEIQQRVSEIETSISLYTKYQSDIVDSGKMIGELEKILRNVTPKDKGIPLLYMRRFFDRIRIQCNQLLDITYDGSLKLGTIDPSSPVFDIPYIKDSQIARDVKTASQGERPLIDIALSFAMGSLLSHCKYNILCCDELDSTLDFEKKMKYPEMLNLHITSSGIDQCFTISHSEVFNTIPTNVINMSSEGRKYPGENVYEIIRT